QDVRHLLLVRHPLECLQRHHTERDAAPLGTSPSGRIHPIFPRWAPSGASAATPPADLTPRRHEGKGFPSKSAASTRSVGAWAHRTSLFSFPQPPPSASPAPPGAPNRGPRCNNPASTSDGWRRATRACAGSAHATASDRDERAAFAA